MSLPSVWGIRGLGEEIGRDYLKEGKKTNPKTLAIKCSFLLAVAVGFPMH